MTGRTAAFTLIELIIALAAGLLIILTSTAAFRMGLRSLTAANRIATENAMMRIGFDLACEEIDFWTTLDQPEDPTRQPLRRKAPDAEGFLPFTPFKTAEFQLKAKDPPEDTTGWDPNPMAWAADDPRSWCRANFLENVNSNDLPWGNASIFSHIEPGNVQAAHHWYGGQVKGVVDALGFYGMCDYLPSSAFFTYHGRAPRDAPTELSRGGIPLALQKNGSWLCCDNYYGEYTPKGRLNPTYTTRLFMPPATTKKDLLAIVRQTPPQVGGATLLSTINMRSSPRPLMEMTPADWPQVTVKTMRLIYHGQPISVSIIDCFNPRDGRHVVLPFTAHGTSLRGARQQRRPGQGWVEDPYTEATLDYDKVP